MKRTMKVFGWIFLLALFLGILVNLYMIVVSADRIRKIEETKDAHYDCALVLGASIIDNSTPSMMLQDRLDTAILAYEQGLTDRLIMSGDHREDDYNEPEAMKQYAIARGVPADAIELDHSGTSTFNSIRYLQENCSGQKVLIVTQRYHLYRALYIAKAKGVEADGLDAALQTYSSAAFNTAREFLARIKDFGAVLFNLNASDIHGI